MRPSEQLRFWAHELAAMATTGLEFATNDHDRGRYRRVAAIASDLAAMTIDATFTPERPYLADTGVVSVKVGCFVAVFDDQGRVVLIERSDNGRWALPWGYADVGGSPSENALRELAEETGLAAPYPLYCGVGEANTPAADRELAEETGLSADIERFVGVYDNRRFGSTAAYHFYTLLFRGRLTGGEARPSAETTQVQLVDPNEAPENMSALQRTMLADAVASAREPVFQ